MVSEQVTALDVEGVLDAVQTWHDECNDREMRIFLAAGHYADLHGVDVKPHRGGRILPGMEKPIRLGGAGTPKVWEFAPAEFATRLGRSSYAGRALVADALDTRHRLPRLWARVCAGEVPVSYARHVAQRTRELSAEAAGFVDAEVATYADGRLTWSRFEALVAGKITAADPERAARLEREAAEDEFAKVGRSNDHGQKTLYARTTTAVMVRIDATLAYYANILAVLGDTDTEDQRRAKALLIMANPLRALQLLQLYTQRRSQSTSQGSAQDSDSSGSDSDSVEGEPDPPDDSNAGDTDGRADTEEGEGAFDDLDDSDAADADEPDEPGSGQESGETSGTANSDAGAGCLQRFRPHEIRPDTRFAFGFDPAKLLPTVVVYLHLYARTDTGEVGPVARWEGQGPVTTAYVRDILGPTANFVVKPVIDLAGMAPVDGYEVPDRLREAVHLRGPGDGFPFAANTTRTKQHDHTTPYVPPDHGGPPTQTHLGNLAGLTTLHHRIKTWGKWTVKQPYSGVLLWRDPHGRLYLVDHTGTRTLGRTHPVTDTDTDMCDHTIDVHPFAPGMDIYYQPAHAS